MTRLFREALVPTRLAFARAGVLACAHTPLADSEAISTGERERAGATDNFLRARRQSVRARCPRFGAHRAHPMRPFDQTGSSPTREDT